MCIKKFREEYPVTKNYIYLNHAAVSPLNKRSEKYLNNYLKNMMFDGNTRSEEIFNLVEETKKIMAKFINAESKDLAFVKNTTAGLNHIANGIDWQKGDEIIVPDKEFPANIYPWQRLKEEGVILKQLKADFSNNRIENLKELITDNTRLIAISFVQYHNGYKENLEQISQICHKNKILLCVDAIQGLGALPFSVKEIPIDFMTWSCHKWMLGPEGIGFLYINPKHLNTLKVKNSGWLRRVDFMDFTNTNQPLLPEASKFEEGTLNVSGIVTFRGSLDIITEIGIKNIKNHIFSLNGMLADQLIKKGYIITSYQSTAHESGILTFFHPKKDSSQLHEYLKKEKIITSLRNGQIRVAPHFYITFEEIEKSIKIL